MAENTNGKQKQSQRATPKRLTAYQYHQVFMWLEQHRMEIQSSCAGLESFYDQCRDALKLGTALAYSSFRSQCKQMGITYTRRVGSGVASNSRGDLKVPTYQLLLWLDDLYAAVGEERPRDMWLTVCRVRNALTGVRE